MNQRIANIISRLDADAVERISQRLADCKTYKRVNQDLFDEVVAAWCAWPCLRNWRELSFIYRSRSQVARCEECGQLTEDFFENSVHEPFCKHCGQVLAEPERLSNKHRYGIEKRLGVRL